MRRLLLLLLLALLTVQGAALRLAMRERAFVTDSQVRLRDVATRLEGDRDLYDSLADIVVLDLPWEQQYRNLYAQELVNSLLQKTGRTVDVKSGVCVVRWKQEDIAPENIRLSAESFLRQTLMLNADARIICERIPQVRAPEGAFEVRYEMPRQSTNDILLRGAVMVEGREANSFLLHARVELTREVLALREPKRRGEVISAADVVSQKQVGSYLSTAYMNATTLENVIAARYLPAGTVIDQTNTERKPDVERGRRVLVDVHNGSVDLQLEAEAKRNGCVGDVIECENAGQRFKALVTGPGRVAIDLED